MADYGASKEAIRSQIASAVTLAPLLVSVDAEFVFCENWVGIYSGARRLEDSYNVTDGRRTRYAVDFEVHCWAFSMDAAGARARRDDLLGQVELAILRDRTFSGALETCSIGAVAFDSGASNDTFGAFWAGARLSLEARLSVVT